MRKKAVKLVSDAVTKYEPVDASYIVVDPNSWKGTGLFTRVVNKIINQNNIQRASASLKDFNTKSFPEFIVRHYNQMHQHLYQLNKKELFVYLSEPNFKVIPTSELLMLIYGSTQLLKNISKRSELDSLPWTLSKDCVGARIVQARHYIEGQQEAFMGAKATDKTWYQLTVEHTFKEGPKRYHVLERKMNTVPWKYLYFDC